MTETFPEWFERRQRENTDTIGSPIGKGPYTPGCTDMCRHCERDIRWDKVPERAGWWRHIDTGSVVCQVVTSDV